MNELKKENTDNEIEKSMLYFRIVMNWWILKIMKWRDFVYELVTNYCNERGSRTFTLQEFQNENRQAIQNFANIGKSTKTPLIQLEGFYKN